MFICLNINSISRQHTWVQPTFKNCFPLEFKTHSVGAPLFHLTKYSIPSSNFTLDFFIYFTNFDYILKVPFYEYYLFYRYSIFTNGTMCSIFLLLTIPVNKLQTTHQLLSGHSRLNQLSTNLPTRTSSQHRRLKATDEVMNDSTDSN